MPTYVYRFSEGDKDQKDLLGGKGANLAEMTRLGLPVPPGFTITTDACRAYLKDGQAPDELAVEVTTALRQVEEELGRELGAAHDPLLVSVRSGAKFSMPGMMETVLNIGLNDTSVAGLAEASGDPRFAWDSYRRLIQMFGKTVLDVDGDHFSRALDAKKAERGVSLDYELDVDALTELVEQYKAIVLEHAGIDFPQDPRTQLDMAIEAVFRSWNTERAHIYRRREKIPHDLGTAVNVCTMVFGNMGETSGTGVCFTRDPSTGRSGVYGDYLVNAQGEDVVAGIRNTLSLADLERLDKNSYDDLRSAMRKLETHYRDLCDIEFTIERGKLWLLQTRVGKRTAAAAFRVATQLVDERLITMDEALTRVTGDQLTQLMFPQFDAGHSVGSRDLLTRAMPASPGAAVGYIAFNNAEAVARAEAGESVVLVRRETNPDDLPGMVAAVGVLTARGGKTSHAAVVARGMGKTCVVGADELDVDAEAGTLRVHGREDLVLTSSDVIAIDGQSGEVFLGDVPVTDSPVMTYLRRGLTEALDTAGDVDTRELVTSVDRLMRHADKVRRLEVRANADTPDDARHAIHRGAEGVGLCRTEHMFLGERKQFVQNLILASSDAEREAALDALLPLQKGDFVQMFETMNGKPMTVRLIDPPLHEFLPDLTELSVKVAVDRATGGADPEDERLLAVVRRNHEANPMLGLRGVRLLLSMPGLIELQVRAIAEAAVERLRAGGDPHPEIMIPLVGSVRELQIARERAEAVLREVGEQSGYALDFPIGCMIELPRAAVSADTIAEEADFFSFGTNDLTQTTWGFSRDDVEGTFFKTYLDEGVFGVSPFETIDERGVGRMVEIGAERGRATKPSLKLGVCGEHGGDPESIDFFHRVGLTYVSCSPFRVPVARLEAGRAAVAFPEADGVA
ncbi:MULTISPECIES: pyruvate, phosphate dikinase [unclassified Actinomyces]|uniref:pyruvate, phosphate dikinase n=1 Tax=unclassified Actinomyces TaxID=2609248 RepID=UPI002016EEE3|nr:MULTISPECIES: pyruvate, phosphate dikinase [unclassified Actinomyces]MCL3778692.1 pyruvate, phosphate dikinase [Actinomyces sp. AC-20-1]MCL3789973.1 pyruvate, phosphate dikinase [Actinomyces sp. 187325]MCL3792308.1 pyruvate, phosphate dikinase [Actinomyces sp. 186855]MCL3794514.1 pyruvate, phosphate dikinase [Actinomyces sp. 217892]